VVDHVNGVREAELLLLAHRLSECPAEAWAHGGDHDKNEAEQMELGAVVGEEEEAKGYANDDENDWATLYKDKWIQLEGMGKFGLLTWNRIEAP